MKDETLTILRKACERVGFPPPRAGEDVVTWGRRTWPTANGAPAIFAPYITLALDMAEARRLGACARALRRGLDALERALPAEARAAKREVKIEIADPAAMNREIAKRRHALDVLTGIAATLPTPARRRTA